MNGMSFFCSQIFPFNTQICGSNRVKLTKNRTAMKQTRAAGERRVVTSSHHSRSDHHSRQPVVVVVVLVVLYFASSLRRLLFLAHGIWYGVSVMGHFGPFELSSLIHKASKISSSNMLEAYKVEICKKHSKQAKPHIIEETEV